jgi:putative DNA primase/helicase
MRLDHALDGIERGASFLDREATKRAAVWPEPQPLTAKIDPEPYPLDALPGAIREAVAEVQAFTKAPLPLVATSALSAISLAIQGHYDVRRAEGLRGPCGLFSLVIADSGERKSTVDRYFTSAIESYEKDQAEIAKPLLAKYRAGLDAWEAKKAGIKDRLRQLSKEQKSTTPVETALRDLEDDKPVAPKVPRLIHNDATPEALAHGLVREWASGGVVSAEAGLVFGAHGMGKDSVMRNLSLLNILWDGGRLRIDRRTSESFTVEGARLTVGLQVQEATLRDFLRQSGALARGSGFLARFLIAWPQSTQGLRPFTEPPRNWLALTVFNKRLAAILEQPAPLDDSAALLPAVLDLSPGAKAAWIAFHDTIEIELGPGGELFDVRDVAAKSADNAARLAALFHIFEGGVGPISYEAFVGASQICAWHLNESRRFFGELALPAELADAARLDCWLLDHCQKRGVLEVSSREAQRLGPIRDKDKLVSALHELEDLDRARLTQEGKRKTIRINPALLKVAL